MPLTAKGEEIKSALTKEYGEKKGEQVLYAGKNKGTFTGIDADLSKPDSATMTRIADAISNLQQRFDVMCSRGDAGWSGPDTMQEAMNKKIKQAEDAIRHAAKEQYGGDKSKALESYLGHSTFGSGTITELKKRLGV